MALKYKLTENGNIMTNDKGMPMVIDDEKEGEEFGIDAIANHSRLAVVNNESKERKLKLREIEEMIKPFTDLEGDETFGDFINKALKSIEQVENFDEKAWTKTKDVEAIKKQANENLERKLRAQEEKANKIIDDLTNKVTSRDGKIYDLMVSDLFNSSKFVKEKLAMLPKYARAIFGERFKVEKNENGDLIVVGYHKNGEKIPSRETVGANADFEEALEILVDSDPDKKTLLKGSGASGGGAGDSDGSGGDGNEVNPWKKETLNLTKQGEILDKDPALAKRMANEAGVPLPEAL